ncbi:MAG: hypothetical protein ACPLKZ_03890 [Candidatus Bathyarchaeales archaeon]
MVTHKRFNQKNAISPLLATLLLIVIAVAATVITYAWITTYMGSTTQQASFIPYKANVNFPRSRQNHHRHRQLWNIHRPNSQSLHR